MDAKMGSVVVLCGSRWLQEITIPVLLQSISLILSDRLKELRQYCELIMEPKM